MNAASTKTERPAGGSPQEREEQAVPPAEPRRNDDALRRSQSLLETTLQYMDQGITIVDADLRLLAANRRFREILDFPEALCQPETPFADFIRYNAMRGDYGPGDPEEQTAARVALARRFQPHHFERERPDGTVIDIRGLPVPGGGFVTTYTDVTQRVHAERATRRLARMYEALSATNEAILHSRSPEELYQRVCDAAVHGGKFFTAAVMIPDADTGYAQVVAATGAGAPQLRAARGAMGARDAEGHGLAGIAFRTRAPSISNDFLQDERTSPWHAEAQRAGVSAAAAIPLLRSGLAVGTLLFHSNEKDAFDDEIVNLIRRMAENLVYALENFEHEAERRQAEERIQHLATHDALTGLPNRLMFHQLLDVTLQSARRYQRRFAVLYTDLDGFKRVNDTLGHEAGDNLLAEIAARLKQALRSSDIVARLGGDEFVVLVQEITDTGQAAVVARKVLAAASGPVTLQGRDWRLSASVGIAMYPSDGEDAQSLLKHADHAMYLAKGNGKNNFRFYAPDAGAAKTVEARGSDEEPPAGES